MEFIKCYLCGELAVQENVTRELTETIFCTSKVCGRYDIEHPALQMLQAGGLLQACKDEITSRVYIANRKAERILVTTSDLQKNSFMTE